MERHLTDGVPTQQATPPLRRVANPVGATCTGPARRTAPTHRSEWCRLRSDRASDSKLARFMLRAYATPLGPWSLRTLQGPQGGRGGLEGHRQGQGCRYRCRGPGGLRRRRMGPQMSGDRHVLAPALASRDPLLRFPARCSSDHPQHGCDRQAFCDVGRECGARAAATAKSPAEARAPHGGRCAGASLVL
jgi:hypothetical protein